MTLGESGTPRCLKSKKCSLAWVWDPMRLMVLRRVKPGPGGPEHQKGVTGARGLESNIQKKAKAEKLSQNK